MYFKAKSYKIPIYVIFVSLRAAALSATGVCSLKAMFTIDDFITKFSSAKCPCHTCKVGQSSREGSFLSDSLWGSESLCVSLCGEEES